MIDEDTPPKERKESARKERERDKTDTEDLKFLLGEKQGRRFLWKLLGETKLFEAVWQPGEWAGYYAGRQDVGRVLFGRIVKVDPQALIVMQTEADALEMERA